MFLRKQYKIICDIDSRNSFEFANYVYANDIENMCSRRLIVGLFNNFRVFMVFDLFTFNVFCWFCSIRVMRTVITSVGASSSTLTHSYL